MVDNTDIEKLKELVMEKWSFGDEYTQGLLLLAMFLTYHEEQTDQQTNTLLNYQTGSEIFESK